VTVQHTTQSHCVIQFSTWRVTHDDVHFNMRLCYWLHAVCARSGSRSDTDTPVVGVGASWWLGGPDVNLGVHPEIDRNRAKTVVPAQPSKIQRRFSYLKSWKVESEGGYLSGGVTPRGGVYPPPIGGPDTILGVFQNPKPPSRGGPKLQKVFSGFNQEFNRRNCINPFVDVIAPRCNRMGPN